MNSITLKTKANELPGVGSVYQKKLEKLGIHSVEDLLLYLPRAWEDFSKITEIAKVRAPGSYCIEGNIWSIGNKRSHRKRMNITEAIIADKTGTMKAVWFNQPFLIKNMKQGDEVLLAGRVENEYGQAVMKSPAYEKKADKQTHLGKIVPTYKETAGLSSRWLRYQISKLVKVIYSFKEYLPAEVIKNQGLISYSAMIRQLHFPDNSYQLEKALDRLNFDEMFLLQLAVQRIRKSLDKNRAISIQFNEDLSKEFVKSLGFTLTGAQKKAVWEIIKDLEKPTPMNRLLEGDVGSGKTVVAAMATLMAAKAGFQTVFLAPTEILARQHYESLKKMLEPFEVNVALLTGKTTILPSVILAPDRVEGKAPAGIQSDKDSAKLLKSRKNEKDEILRQVQEGDIHILVGTHAVLKEELDFWNLAFAIVDEQHRFGVAQRAKLRQKSGSDGTMPHFLSMSATPIPRTLTLSVYGDLDISVIDEMPPGRKKVATFLIPPEKKEDSYEFIRQTVKKGRQIFVICPLIDDSEVMELKSVTAEYERLSRMVFTDLKIATLHGKMRPEEKERVMNEFASGKIDILVSTSLVEVGVDVPNATIMIIEGADRFGLAQLHQFRGRVGRGKYQSYCFLFTDNDSETVQKRLDAITKTNDGFKIAEKDLEIRGPGEILGERQHGLPDINTKNLMNIQLIKRTKTEAKNFLKNHDVADLPLLEEKIKKYDGVASLE
ncbi:ATP-dependent DNA helicase RecG [candidate division WS5 bacterium]|uniref:Probable DNA 3'-5' helicase RecG n=1 Tax=candidate division WS5 bacterium TaxID=2093353 RepID=A0A419DAI6_9BACT|nr:MAG: ATP-dependent DNA helicase RecG [candidate division WS5 bacterium]